MSADLPKVRISLPARPTAVPPGLPSPGTVVEARVLENLGGGAFSLQWAGGRIAVSSRLDLTVGQELVLKSETSPDGKAVLVIQVSGEEASGRPPALYASPRPDASRVLAAVAEPAEAAAKADGAERLADLLEPLPPPEAGLSGGEKAAPLRETAVAEVVGPESKVTFAPGKKGETQAPPAGNAQDGAQTAAREKGAAAAPAASEPEIRDLPADGKLLAGAAERLLARALSTSPARDTVVAKTVAGRMEELLLHAAGEPPAAPDGAVAAEAAGPENNAASVPGKAGEAQAVLPENASDDMETAALEKGASDAPSAAEPGIRDPSAGEKRLAEAVERLLIRSLADIAARDPALVKIIAGKLAELVFRAASPETAGEPPPAPDGTVAADAAESGESAPSVPGEDGEAQAAQSENAPDGMETAAREKGASAVPEATEPEVRVLPADGKRLAGAVERLLAWSLSDARPGDLVLVGTVAGKAAELLLRAAGLGPDSVSPAAAAAETPPAPEASKPDVRDPDAAGQPAEPAELPPDRALSDAARRGRAVPKAVAEKAAGLLLRAVGLTPGGAALEAAEALMRNGAQVDRRNVQALLSLAAGYEGAEKGLFFRAAAKLLAGGFPLTMPLASGMADVLQRDSGASGLLRRAMLSLEAGEGEAAFPPGAERYAGPAREMLAGIAVDLDAVDAGPALEKYMGTLGRENMAASLLLIEKAAQAVLESHPLLSRIDRALAAVLALVGETPETRTESGPAQSVPERGGAAPPPADQGSPAQGSPAPVFPDAAGGRMAILRLLENMDVNEGFQAGSGRQDGYSPAAAPVSGGSGTALLERLALAARLETSIPGGTPSPEGIPSGTGGGSAGTAEKAPPQDGKNAAEAAENQSPDTTANPPPDTTANPPPDKAANPPPDKAAKPDGETAPPARDFLEILPPRAHPGANKPEVDMLRPMGLLEKVLNAVARADSPPPGEGGLPAGRPVPGDAAKEGEELARRLLSPDAAEAEQAAKELPAKDRRILRETALRLLDAEKQALDGEPSLAKLSDAAASVKDLGRQILAMKAENLSGVDRNPGVMVAEVPFKLADDQGDGRLQMFYRKKGGGAGSGGWSSRVILDLNTTRLGPVLGDIRFFRQSITLNVFVDSEETAGFLNAAADELASGLNEKGFSVTARFMLMPRFSAAPAAESPAERRETGENAISGEKTVQPAAKKKPGRLDMRI